ncbi:MAG: MBL fold metallo-hydrolase [Desulfobacterales bacterium]
MEKPGVSVADLDMIFISHLHLDHVGGMTEQNKTFSLSQGLVSLPDVPAYVPANLSPSSWNPGPDARVIEAPTALNPASRASGLFRDTFFLWAAP